MKILLFFIESCFLALYGSVAFAQSYEVCPTVPDFMDLEQPWVTATYGTTRDPFEHIGRMFGRHTLITEQGTDFLTRDGLQLIPEGTDRVIRLGNSNLGAEAESITYRFIADRKRSLLLLDFAVVFEDPDHGPVYQPRFVVQVLDRNGNLVEACAEYDVRAKKGMEGFHVIEQNGSWILWRDWTRIGLDLSAYGGEEIQVRFITYDCDLSGHFGYAYFYASCVSSRLSVHDCQDAGFELQAPGNFASYLWSNGETTPVSVWNKEEPDLISCELTSVTGCRFTLFSTLAEPGLLPEQDTLVYDTVCEGDEYHRHGFHLSAQSHSGTYSNVLLDVADCNAPREVNLVLALNVIQKYMHLEEYICEGEDYVKYGFDIRKPAAGLHQDTVEISVSGRCGSYRVLDLQVSPAKMQPRVIIGDQTPCGGEVVGYHISQKERGDRYQWLVPEGVTVPQGMTLPAASLRFPLEGLEDTLKLRVLNGCGSYEATLPLEVAPSYRRFYEDTICTGMVYRKHGFTIPAKEEAGGYVEIDYQRTARGCDSVAVLQLEVVGIPEVKIELKDSVFCAPEEITLTPVLEGVKIRKDVGIGDVVCTDGSVLGREAYGASGKVAKAVVFWVDSTGQHGWAVDVWEPEEELYWGREPNLPLKRYRFVSDALRDYNGRKNTDLVIEAGLDQADGSPRFPVFKAIVRGEEWYLPAAGQLDMLFASHVLVNQTLHEVGGKLLQTEDCSYCSSSMAVLDSYWVWYLEISSYNPGVWTDRSMRIPGRARGICNF